MNADSCVEPALLPVLQTLQCSCVLCVRGCDVAEGYVKQMLQTEMFGGAKKGIILLEGSPARPSGRIMEIQTSQWWK